MPPDDLAWIARATRATRVERGERIQSLWSGYGEIRRVTLHGASTPTAILKSVTPPAGRRADDRSHARKCASYDVELAWYRGHAARCDRACRVPAWIDGARTDEGWSFLLEDLDAAGFAGRRRRGASALDVDLCLGWLAAFHARFLGESPAGLWNVGTYWHLATRPDELAAIDDPALRAAAPILDAKLRAARHQTFVHGDAKVANFCFGDGAVAAVDFQYVGGGCGMSDVAYFLGSWADDGHDPDEERHLDRYFELLRAALVARAIDAAPVEAEWRVLYPIAAADFHRFLAGWSKDHWSHDAHGRAVVRRVLDQLR